ncbi:MAG: hypothetical protein J3K34DRAFT_413440 [Monoraphidium minutum]|nr:MAG: hypothetical protein J3K34DRAFT_413440 [Monoraphidium minutum]
MRPRGVNTTGDFHSAVLLRSSLSKDDSSLLWGAVAHVSEQAHEGIEGLSGAAAAAGGGSNGGQQRPPPWVWCRVHARCCRPPAGAAARRLLSCRSQPARALAPPSRGLDGVGRRRRAPAAAPLLASARSLLCPPPAARRQGAGQDPPPPSPARPLAPHAPCFRPLLGRSGCC